MSHVPQHEIDKICRETGMGQVQAYYHAKARHELQERAKREREARAAHAVRMYAQREKQQ